MRGNNLDERPRRDARKATVKAAVAKAQAVVGDEGIRLGFHLKRERRLKGLNITEVAEAAGISPSLISKIEHNKLDPSLSTLHRLAKALGVSISALFAAEEQVGRVVMTKEERTVAGVDGPVTASEGIAAEILVPHEAGRQLEGFLFVMEPNGHSGGNVQHEGEEVGYVIEGELELTVGGTVYRLKAGDSFYFNSSTIHSYRNPGDKPATVIWINTPPTF